MNTAAQNTIATLKIDNSRIMDSIERAYLKVTSPTGKTIIIMKITLWKGSEEAQEVFWKFCGCPMERFVGDKEATRRDMEMLLELARIK